MKVLFIFAATAALIYAQDAKVAPAASSPQVPSERNLSEAEALKLQLLAAKIQIVQDKYQIPKYQEEVKPIADEQNALATNLCKSVGIPEALVQTQCGIQTGVGTDGKPLLDAAGKPVTPRVFWNKPAPPLPVTDKK